MMAKAMADEGLQLTHIIGPATAHQYEPHAKQEISRRIDAIAERGRDPLPARVRFTTWTLRYNQMFWVTVDGLEEHWERARVDAKIASTDRIDVKTKNISALTLSMPSGSCPLDSLKQSMIMIDGKNVTAPHVESDRSWTARLEKRSGSWQIANTPAVAGLRKQHGLQGPIDDAFMDSFIMVSPTGTAMNPKVGAWAAAEERHAIDHWRRQFRGEARVKTDDQITEDDIASNNLVLWGDPKSNKILGKIADQLPVHWNEKGVNSGTNIFSAEHCVPVMIYPNPLNPKHYVVVNSGFTFREYDYLSNARQVPKLPDYAVIDLDTPPSPRAPGKIVDAGFFDEQWKLK